MPMLRAISLLQTDSHFWLWPVCFEIIQLPANHRAPVSSHVYTAWPAGYSMYTVMRGPNSVSTYLSGSPPKQSVLTAERDALKSALHGAEATE